MSSVYLVRHGQAGPRYSYDSLSQLGQRQASLLGEHFAAQRMQFKAIYSGALRRQQETALAAWQASREAGLAQPEPIIDPGWNEFDLDQVYKELAPILNASDPQFRQDYEEMLRLAADDSSPIHRTWSSCDVAIVRAWVEGRHPSREPWRAFQERIGSAWKGLRQHGSGEAVAVFTSATPIAVGVGMSLGVVDGTIWKLAGVMYNTAISSLRIKDGEATLFSFNSVPHLKNAELRTFR